MKNTLTNPQTENRSPKGIRKPGTESASGRRSDSSDFARRPFFGFQSSVLGFQAVLLSAFSFQLSAFAQSDSIDWHTIDGGGGTSTGGVYSVSGTIGQPDAGKMSGGTYTVDGGFWGIISVVQSPGAPLLSIARTTTNTVAVFWPSPSAGFSLQVNTNGSASVNWSNVVPAPSDNGTTRTVVVNPPTGNRFYRLFKP